MKLHGHHVPHISFWDYTSLQSADESSAASQSSVSTSEDEFEWDGPVWDESALRNYVNEKPGRCVVLLDGYAIDVTRYLGEHVRCLFLQHLLGLMHPVL